MLSLTAMVFTAALAAGATDPAPAAATTAAPPPAKAAAPAPDPKQVICTHEAVTGSRLGGGRICHTREEWTELTAESRREAEGLQARGGMAIPPGK